MEFDDEDNDLEQFQPSEVIAAVVNSDFGLMVVITPEEYFRQKGYQYDQHFDVAGTSFLMDKCDMEGWWAAPMATVESNTEYLQTCGIRVDSAFQAMIDSV